jgi:glycosyltransferase involved in cell wall biosynthesis
MAAADIYCQPNTGPEPFGIALVEALNAGLPVVTSDLGGAREIVTEACGLTCAPGDSARLAAILERLIVNPAERLAMGKAGPVRGQELCDPERQIKAMATALDSPTGVKS